MANRTETSLMDDEEGEEGVQSGQADQTFGLSGNIPKRHARVTVKYNRKELQKRLDVEKWIDESLDQLYEGQEGDMPEEVNIDGLIDLPDDEKRIRKLQAFIRELVEKLEGVHKQEELQSEGIEHPVICHSHYRHEPYHFNNPHHHMHHSRGQNQTL
ncbi:protein phosphatase 1%2C regulatory (inhibitor) subunit 14Aa [Xyrichtys novacula]|uniref:Protein phosphatase 1, regulatory (Inhibitor) subunit 14Aa n=1 Tax=Xyrichtys novacula TaxID=13765 RepID=A0AAV1FSX9_XYRNO|nr:protein phosphatase 1%2C regulatory (inhibitor) subunit 14Aa [Xyrichtys novacula]